jgi:integrase
VKILRAFLLWNERFANGQRGLRESIRRAPLPLPRTIFATDDERERLLQMANPGLRFFILLCADLGLRHTTALSITPRHYNPIDKTIFFTTKNGFQQQLPVTPEIAHTMQFLPPTASPDNPVYATLNGYQTERGKRSRAMHAAFRKLKLDTGVRLELRSTTSADPLPKPPGQPPKTSAPSKPSSDTPTSPPPTATSTTAPTPTSSATPSTP